MKLTQALVPVVRRKMLAEQGYMCCMCGYPCEDSQAVLDHDHDSGHIRGVAHRGCNALEGTVTNNRPRHMLKDDEQMRAWLNNYLDYVNADYSHQPFYPTHKTAAEKKAASYEKQRKKLIKARIAANPDKAKSIKEKESALRKVRADRNRPRVKGKNDE